MEGKAAIAIVVAVIALLLLGSLAGSPLAGLLGGGYLLVVASIANDTADSRRGTPYGA